MRTTTFVVVVVVSVVDDDAGLSVDDLSTMMTTANNVDVFFFLCFAYTESNGPNDGGRLVVPVGLAYAEACQELKHSHCRRSGAILSQLCNCAGYYSLSSSIVLHFLKSERNNVSERAVVEARSTSSFTL